MQRVSIAYLAVAAVAAAVYLAGPWSIRLIAIQYVVHELAAVAAIVVALWIRRSTAPALWWILATSLLLWAVGDVFWFSSAIRGESPFPSPADGFYLVGYLGLAAGLTSLVSARQRRRRAGDLLDALLVSVGVGVPLWLVTIGPVVSDPTAGLGGQLVGTAYAVVVLALIVLVSWFGFGGALRTVSGRLLVAGFLCLIAANVGYSVELLQDLYAPGAGLDAGWLAFFGLTGAAALHPSMAELGRARQLTVAPASKPRIVFVWAMASIPPSMILLELGAGRARLELLVAAAIGTLLGVALMAVRVLLLLEQTGLAARSEGEQRLVAMVEHLDDVISLHDRDGGVRWVSPAAEHVWGIDADDRGDADLVGGLIHPDDREAFLSTLAEVADDAVGDLRRLEARIETPTIGRRDVEITAVNQLANPAIGGIVVTFHDVTIRSSQRRALEQHAEAQSDLADQLQRVQEMKDAFLTAVSHDLRTPLTSIRGMSELLTVRGDLLHNDQRRELIERLAANAERLERLLLELLDLDRLTRGIRRPSRELVHVTRLAEEIIEQETFRDAPIELSGHCSAAEVDAAMTGSILSNLIGNAVKHNPPGTPVWVRVDPFEGSGVRIVVEDAGRGIPASQREHVVEPFTRLDQSRSTPGSGLGLALIATFTRLHDGRFHIRDRPGGGTCCVAEIPPLDTALRGAGLTPADNTPRAANG